MPCFDKKKKKFIVCIFSAKDSSLFTIAFHHSGKFEYSPNLVYIGGTMDFADNVDLRFSFIYYRNSHFAHPHLYISLPLVSSSLIELNMKNNMTRMATTIINHTC